MLTVTGRMLDAFNDADLRKLSVHDCMYALSNEPRWGGMTPTPWSVLDHQLACYDLARKTSADAVLLINALCHDMGEAVCKDMPRWLKHRPEMKWYRDFEQHVTSVLFDAWGIPYLHTPELKAIDNAVGAMEEWHFFTQGQFADAGVVKRREPHETRHLFIYAYGRVKHELESAS
jgi:hypothetical protein